MTAIVDTTPAGARKAAFLEAFSAPPEGRYAVAAAAAAVGVHRATPYRWRATDPAFAAAWRAIELHQWAQVQQRVAVELARRQAAHDRRNAELRPRRQAQARRNFGHDES